MEKLKEPASRTNTGCLSTVDLYFKHKREIEHVIRCMERIGGTGRFIPEFVPAIHRMLGMLDGMNKTERDFDL